MVSPARFDALLRAILMIFAAASVLIPVLILFELQPENQSQVRKQKQVSGSNHILVHVGRIGFLFDLHKGK